MTIIVRSKDKLNYITNCGHVMGFKSNGEAHQALIDLKLNVKDFEFLNTDDENKTGGSQMQNAKNDELIDLLKEEEELKGKINIGKNAETELEEIEPKINRLLISLLKERAC